jgi:hypothetical protein
MGARVALSREQLLRLMQLVEAITAQRGGDADAAIAFLQDSVAAGLNKPSYKSVTQFAAGMRAIRLRRNEVLGKPVFRDPAWDMLIDLVVAADERRAVSVSGLCHASGVPTTTALRHVERLETLGLLTRTPDPADKRRFWVDAEPEALGRVREIIARLQAEA